MIFNSSYLTVSKYRHLAWPLVIKLLIQAGPLVHRALERSSQKRAIWKRQVWNKVWNNLPGNKHNMRACTDSYRKEIRWGKHQLPSVSPWLKKKEILEGIRGCWRQHEEKEGGE